MENHAPESVKQLIRKIHTLSLRGIGGEADVAKRKLNELLEKHGIDLDDVVRDIPKTYQFNYNTSQEERLIVQCYYSLNTEDRKVYEYTRAGRKRKVLGLNLTAAQYIDLKGMVDYYKAALKKENDRLFVAFIQRHKLYSDSTGEERSSPPMSVEELGQMVAMMRGLGEKSYFKPAGLISN